MFNAEISFLLTVSVITVGRMGGWEWEDITHII